MTTARYSNADRVAASDHPTSTGSSSGRAATNSRSRPAWAASPSADRPDTTHGTTPGPTPARPPARRPARARPASGGWASTAWQLVPPMPNELTPASTGPPGGPGRAHGPSPCWMRRFSSASGISGFGVWKFRLAGISRCQMARATLISPAMPAAPSRCPILVLTEPTASGEPGGRARPMTDPSAAASTGSPALVPVPCSSTY